MRRIVSLVAALGYASICLLGCAAQHAVSRHQEDKLAARQVTFGPVAELAPACSPDSRWVAFEYFHPKPKNTAPQIWIMPADGDFSSAKPLVDNGEYHAGISWSPDSKWVSFIEARKLREEDVFVTSQVYKVRVDTRQVIQITQLPPRTVLGDDTAWSRNGQIAFQKEGDVYAVPENGGNARKLFDLNSRDIQIPEVANMMWSPDGERLAFVAGRIKAGPESEGIWIADAATQGIKPITKGGTTCCPFWASNFTLLFSREETEGNSRIYSISTDRTDVQQLTSGPFDDSPCLDSIRGVVFFNHNETTQIEYGDWGLPKVHVWKKKLGRRTLKHLLPRE